MELAQPKNGWVTMGSDNNTVTLREVTAENVSEICDLSVSNEQKLYVAPNAKAIAEACYAKDEWLLAIYADDTPVGLAVVKTMLNSGEHLLWRLMIDTRYQGRGIGRQAMLLLVEYVKRKPNGGVFLTSVVPGDHSPQGFYESLGFQLTGEWYEEAMMSLAL